MKMPEPSPLGMHVHVSVLLQLFHSIQGTASLKPLNLCLVEGVIQYDGLLAPIGMFDDAFQRLRGKQEISAFLSLPPHHGKALNNVAVH